MKYIKKYVFFVLFLTEIFSVDSKHFVDLLKKPITTLLASTAFVIISTIRHNTIETKSTILNSILKNNRKDEKITCTPWIPICNTPTLNAIFKKNISYFYIRSIKDQKNNIYELEVSDTSKEEKINNTLKLNTENEIIKKTKTLIDALSTNQKSENQDNTNKKKEILVNNQVKTEELDSILKKYKNNSEINLDNCIECIKNLRGLLLTPAEQKETELLGESHNGCTIQNQDKTKNLATSIFLILDKLNLEKYTTITIHKNTLETSCLATLFAYVACATLYAYQIILIYQNKNNYRYPIIFFQLILPFLATGIVYNYTTSPIPPKQNNKRYYS